MSERARGASELSVIIATHARPDSLARLIASLRPQLLPGRHELLIADNGTPEPVPIADRDVIAAHIHDPRPGKCRVQNLAFANARGDLTVFLDDDVTVAPDYLAAVERFFAGHREFAAMKGRILPQADPRAVAGDRWPYLDLPLVDHGERVIEVRGVLGANMAFRARAMREVGPFDERLGPGGAGHEEETEMSARLVRHGYRIGYAPGAVAYHEVDPARADRARFVRIARERGRCRMIHEHHSILEIAAKNAIGALRVAIASAAGAGVERMAREERRWAVARGMFEGRRTNRR